MKQSGQEIREMILEKYVDHFKMLFEHKKLDEEDVIMCLAKDRASSIMLKALDQELREEVIKMRKQELIKQVQYSIGERDAD